MHAAEIKVVVTNPLDTARPDALVSFPYDEIKKRLPELKFEQLTIAAEDGVAIPFQVTSPRQAHSGPPVYGEILFQHDFTAKASATFTIATTDKPEPPFASKVSCRLVPERFDDFAWENDKIARRAYGSELETDSAGKDKMISSGIDIWVKRVPWPVVDRFYRKGHDGLHVDTGEGMDFYSVGTTRGVGGTGVWDGKTLRTSRNFTTATVHETGPLRASFTLRYAPFAVDDGVNVSETKCVIVSAGTQFDDVESTFDFTPAPGGDGTIVIAIGLATHAVARPVVETIKTGTDSQPATGEALILWENYPDYNGLGTAVIYASGGTFDGFAKTEKEQLLLVRVKPGETVRYRIGAVWAPVGEIESADAWKRQVAAEIEEGRAPLKTSLPPFKAPVAP